MGKLAIFEEISIESRDYWVKVVGMLQQNWALIGLEKDGSTCIYFIGDTSGVFDTMYFSSVEDASSALLNNGFSCYAGNLEFQTFLYPPDPPFHRGSHPNGPIYSSGKFWKS